MWNTTCHENFNGHHGSAAAMPASGHISAVNALHDVRYELCRGSQALAECDKACTNKHMPEEAAHR